MNIHGIARASIGACLLTALAGFIPGCEHNEAHSTPANVAGLWTVVGIWTEKAEVEFKQNDKDVFALVAKDKVFWTFTGVMTDDALAGTFVASNSGQPITIDAQVSGNDMRGWWTLSPEKGTFTATRNQ